MVARPYWSGHIKFSLVSFPVQLYSAIDSGKRISLHKIHTPSGERVHYQEIVHHIGPVPSKDIAKGYEYSKGRYVLLEPEEIDQIRIPSKKTLEIIQCVNKDAIDPVYFENPYYIVPQGAVGEEAFAIIRDALKETGKIAIGQIVLSGKEHIAALIPLEEGILLETLHYAEEVRPASQFFQMGKNADHTDEDQLTLAKELIERKTSPFEPERFEDHYRKALQELITAKIEDRDIVQEPEEEAPENVVNLMEALKRSLGEEKPAKPAAKKPARARASTRKQHQDA